MIQQKSEHDIQTQIRINISENKIRSFRINVGIGWSGNDIKHHSNGSITITDARPFATFGSVDETKKLKGFSDLFCVVPVVVTPEMLGQTIGVAGFVEVRSLTGKPSKNQLDFINQMKSLGARAGVARNPDYALKILRGELL